MVRSESCHDEVLLEPARHIRRFRAPWKTQEAARAFAGSAKTIIDKGSLPVASCPTSEQPKLWQPTTPACRMRRWKFNFTVALNAYRG